MFHAMMDVLAWGVAISFVAFALAFFAEGRGLHLLRVVLGLAPRKDGLDNFTSVPRDEGDWAVVDVLSDDEAQTREQIRRERSVSQ